MRSGKPFRYGFATRLVAWIGSVEKAIVCYRRISQHFVRSVSDEVDREEAWVRPASDKGNVRMLSIGITLAHVCVCCSCTSALWRPDQMPEQKRPKAENRKSTWYQTIRRTIRTPACIIRLFCTPLCAQPSPPSTCSDNTRRNFCGVRGHQMMCFEASLLSIPGCCCCSCS